MTPYEERGVLAVADRDATLVAQLRGREAGAAEELVGAYGDRVYRLAIRITGSPSDAEEVTQDALWTASRKIDSFRGAAVFRSWLYRITANAAYQKLRGRRNARHEISWDDLPPAFDGKGQYLEPAADWSSRLRDPAIDAELRAALRTAIDDLPGSTGRPSSCTTWKGSRSRRSRRRCTVKSRVNRARLFLRKRLAELR